MFRLIIKNLSYFLVTIAPILFIPKFNSEQNMLGISSWTAAVILTGTAFMAMGIKTVYEIIRKKRRQFNISTYRKQEMSKIFRRLIARFSDKGITNVRMSYFSLRSKPWAFCLKCLEPICQIGFETNGIAHPDKGINFWCSAPRSVDHLKS